MADFQVIVGDDDGTTYSFEVDGQDANRFIGRSIGETVDGDAVGLSGYEVEISTGREAGSPSAARRSPRRPDRSTRRSSPAGMTPSRSCSATRPTARTSKPLPFMIGTYPHSVAAGPRSRPTARPGSVWGSR